MRQYNRVSVESGSQDRQLGVEVMVEDHDGRMAVHRYRVERRRRVRYDSPKARRSGETCRDIAFDATTTDHQPYFGAIASNEECLDPARGEITCCQKHGLLLGIDPKRGRLPQRKRRQGSPDGVAVLRIWM